LTILRRDFVHSNYRLELYCGLNEPKFIYD
jgi:hypothetical protein